MCRGVGEVGEKVRLYGRKSSVARMPEWPGGRKPWLLDGGPVPMGVTGPPACRAMR